MKKLNDNNQFEKTIALYEDQIVKQNKQSTSLVINQALKACIELSDIKRVKCGDHEKSREIFINSNNKTTSMLNNILKGLVDNNCCEEALNLFKDTNITKNEYTFSILFKICTEIADQRSLEFGKLIFDKMPKKYHTNIVVLTCALQMFIKSGEILTAEELFNQVQEKNLILFSVMMNGFISNKMAERAIDLFYQIKKPDKIILSIFFNACAQLKSTNALNLGKKVFDQLVTKSNPPNDLLYSVLNMFIKCDDLVSAESLFNRVDRDLISYGSMMKFYNIKNQPEKTLELFQRMKQENLNPNEIIFTIVIDAVSQIGDLSLSQSLVSEIPKKFLLNPWIQVGLIDLWGKVGSPDESRKIFDTIEHPNNISFTAMINAYGLNGMGIEAVELFNKVPSNMLDNYIYVCVLNACSHSALIDQAWKIFEKIPVNQRTAQIYTTMIDALSRVFLFDQAQKLIDEYEKFHEPDIAMYMSMLSSSRNARNFLLAEKICHRIENNFSDNNDSLTSARILLANTYALTGNKSLSSNIRMKLNESNMKKVVGSAWTVINGKVHKFRAHDRSHPCSSEIYDKLNQLTNQLIKHGYKPDESWITRELNNDETVQSALCGHSERLAIAFNLLQQPTPTRIQIIKNLRVCGDCHLVTKLIAQIYQCLIIVRDANRIHHFYPNGKCSCQDHF